MEMREIISIFNRQRTRGFKADKDSVSYFKPRRKTRQ